MKEKIKKEYNYHVVKCCATCKYSLDFEGVTVCKRPHFDDNGVEEFPIIPMGVCDKWESHI